MSKKEAYEQKLQAQLDEWDAEIDKPIKNLSITKRLMNCSLYRTRQAKSLPNSKMPVTMLGKILKQVLIVPGTL
jgi:hypothetical protein